MWQTPNSKPAPPKGNRTAHGRSRRSLHVLRVSAEIRCIEADSPDGEPAPDAAARILLNDLSSKGVGIFCTHPLIAGQEVAISINLPAKLYLRGVVVHCQEREVKTHIISNPTYGFRIGIEFIFESAAEQAAVSKYCAAILGALYNAAA